MHTGVGEASDDGCASLPAACVLGFRVRARGAPRNDIPYGFYLTR